MEYNQCYIKASTEFARFENLNEDTADKIKLGVSVGEVLRKRRMDVGGLQEVRWRGQGARFFGWREG